MTNLSCTFLLLHHAIVTFSTLLALCAGNPLITGGFPSQRANVMEVWFFMLTGTSYWTQNLIIKTHLPPIAACVSKWISIDSGNGLSPAQCQAITWTNAALLSIWPLGTNFSVIRIKIQTFSFIKMYLKVSSAKRQPFCPGRGELKT